MISQAKYYQINITIVLITIFLILRAKLGVSVMGRIAAMTMD